ncbi:MAG: hypothetical protein EP307_11160 [Rhodobacteraceae bacterium]|nr:MAG: hypothetical protein EP307_11160 [Paracoccaceae bacterium]
MTDISRADTTLHMIKRRGGRRALVLALVGALPCLGPGQQVQAGESDVSATFYLWASGLSGTQSLFGLPPADVKVSFGDILDKVDMAAAGIVEVRGDRFGFLGEFNYVKLSAAATGPGGALTGDLRSKAFFALAAGTWTIEDSAARRVDLIGGIRYFRFDNALTLLPGPVAASDRASWVDATVGVKASFELSEDWSLKTWAMVGGGGSDLSWDVLAAFDYRINDAWSASFGYRAMGVDYTSASFSYDMRQYGPIFGVTRRF